MNRCKAAWATRMRHRLGAVALTCTSLVIAFSPWEMHVKREWSPGESRSPEALAAAEARVGADRLYAGGRFSDAGAAYEEIVETYASSPDPHTQDEVGIARLRLGYIAAKARDFDAARGWFLEAEREYSGTGRTSPDFGGIPDQAAYQACVCIAAKGDQANAVKAFERFIGEHPTSPLIHAAFKRIVRLEGGAPRPHQEALLQAAISKQEEHVRRELSLCGPRALAKLLDALGVPADEGQLAEACGTTAEGTTVAAMVRVLKERGYDARAYSLNRRDIEAVTAPALLLDRDHYVTVLSVAADSMRVYDPMLRSERTLRLPNRSSRGFRAIVITLNPMDI